MWLQFTSPWTCSLVLAFLHVLYHLEQFAETGSKKFFSLNFAFFLPFYLDVLCLFEYFSDLVKNYFSPKIIFSLKTWLFSTHSIFSQPFLTRDCLLKHVASMLTSPCFSVTFLLCPSWARAPSPYPIDHSQVVKCHLRKKVWKNTQQNFQNKQIHIKRSLFLTLDKIN